MSKKATAAKLQPSTEVVQSVQTQVQSVAPDLALLAQIVDATDKGTFLYVAEANYKPMIEQGLVEVHTGMANPANAAEFATRATQAGKQLVAPQEQTPVAWANPQTGNVVQMNQATEQTQAANTESKETKVRIKPVFSKVVKIAPPEDLGKRQPGFGAGRQSVYSFDLMEVGDSFFVAATKENPEPYKTFATTINSAKTKFAKDIPGTSRVNKRGNTVPGLEYTRDFKMAKMDDGEQWDESFKGVKGIGVWRVK